MKTILTNKGEEILIDDNDYDIFGKYTWCLSTRGYPVTRNNSKMYYLHKVICRAPKDYFTDHIDGNKLDVRRSNLRVVTPQQSAWNIGARGLTSHFKGVHWNKHVDKWTAQMIGKNLGSFNDEHLAALMYDFWATYKQGKYARTNFKIVAHN